jgi:hypothetical protein
MAGSKKDFDMEAEVAMLEKIGREVIKELDWDDVSLPLRSKIFLSHDAFIIAPARAPIH